MVDMLRRHLVKTGHGVEQDFRVRGSEVTRIEGFTDAVFAFAVTLLVVSLEVPRTFAELLEVMQGFIAFAICFAMLIQVWHYHYVFFRRYGLQDGYVTLINSILLFVVLFYVYPLKFVFTFLVKGFLYGFTQYARMADGSMVHVVDDSQAALLMVIYGLGFVAVFLLLGLLYYHAYRRRDRLELSPVEIFDTRFSIQSFCVRAGVGLVSVLIAWIGGPGYSGIAGFSYFLLGPALGIHGWRMGKKRRMLLEQGGSNAES